MKVTDVTVSRYVEMIPPDSRHAAGKEVQVVEVQTDGGIVGRGFLTMVIPSGGSYGDISATTIRRYLKPIVTGENPLHIQGIWQQMHDQVMGRLGRRGIIRQSVAAIDMALWDIKGKLLGAPVSDLLGNRKERISTYTNLGQQLSPDKLAEKAADYVQKGHRAFKIRVGRSAVSLEEATQRVRAVRDAIGPDRILMADANGSWDADTAIQMLRDWERFDLYWLEEPVPPEDVEGYIRVHSRAGHTRIAGGEQHAGTMEFTRLLIETGAVDVIQPNVSATGGVTDWLRIYQIAHAKRIPISPWNLQQIHLHMAAGLDGVKWIEYFTRDRNDLTSRLLKGPAIEEGIDESGLFLLPPTSPGFGLELDDGVAERTILKNG